MILREFPDLPPRPKTPRNAPFRREFYRRYGNENVLICAATRSAAYAPFAHTLSIRMAWGGAHHFLVGHRRLSVDDDSYLILNEGSLYGSEVASLSPVGGQCLFFRRGQGAEVHGAMVRPLAGALDDGPTPRPRPLQFAENLRPHDATITPRLLRIRERIVAGCDDEGFFDEQLIDLLAAMIEAELSRRPAGGRLADASPATREELARRLGWAADCILSGYGEPLTLDEIAATARLSKFHLVRLFKRAYGVTPHEFLTRKRVSVARRLLQNTGLSIAEVADQAGFGSRSALFRRLRETYGAGGRDLRRAAGGAAAARGAATGATAAIAGSDILAGR